MAKHNIVVIPGDGIGTEVIAVGVKVLEALALEINDLSFNFKFLDWGSDRYLNKGAMMPEDGIASLKHFDAIYFGSAGDPRVPDHITLWQLRLAICQGLDQYANVRPARLLPGIASPLSNQPDINCIIVRENSEGEYSGAGGRVHTGLDLEVGTEVSIFTSKGCERIQKFAFNLARTRARKKLTLVTKSNAQRHGMVLWDETFESVKSDYPDIRTERVLVDAMAARLVTDPTSVDVIVASNLHADILSDLTAALTGSLGLAPTANINPERETPSMFEPIHGSAFDIMGRGIANPLGAIWSAVMMLEHLKESEAAAKLMGSIESVCADNRILTRDLGGQALTKDVAEAIIQTLSQP